MDKSTVLKYFHNLPQSEPEQFNAGFALYKASPGKNPSTERTLNAGGYTKHNLATLHYELQRTHGITDLEKKPPKVKPEDINVVDPVIVPEAGGNAENVIATLEKKLEVLKNAASSDIKETSPEPVKFRDEYPFLNDPACPNELKILAADKITAYKAYQSAHEKLQQAEAGTLQLSDKDKLRAAQAAEKFFAQGEEIKEEFEHYKATGAILGKHPIFKKLQAEREVAEMTSEECLRFIQSTKSYTSRAKGNIEKAVSEDKKAELQAALNERNYKLALVNTKLGISGK